MILPDHEIRTLCKMEFRPMVHPFIEENLQPASLDVRLGNEFRVFERDDIAFIDMSKPVDITKGVEVPDDSFFTLHPGEFVLGVTMEHLDVPDNLVARIEGKSSLGRLGLIVHATAGYIDPGFIGPITLEMTCLHPLAIRLRPGMLIGQFSFQRMTSPATKPYRGRYQSASGVESSKYGKSMDQVDADRMADAVTNMRIEQ